eukprot:scaffold442_cov397-Prasinococcus_capsulatus_cf.AAC.11
MIVAAPCKSSPPAGLLPSIGLLRRLVCSPSPALSAYLSRNVDSNAAEILSAGLFEDLAHQQSYEVPALATPLLVVKRR